MIETVKIGLPTATAVNSVPAVPVDRSFSMSSVGSVPWGSVLDREKNGLPIVATRNKSCKPQISSMNNNSNFSFLFPPQLLGNSFRYKQQVFLIHGGSDGREFSFNVAAIRNF